MSRQKLNIISKQEWYDFIIAHTANPGAVYERPWVELPTPLTRALAFANRMLEYYRKQEDQLAIADTEWVISKIKSQIKQR